jgi:hypothetical protein
VVRVELLVLERLDREVVHPNRLGPDLYQVLRRLPRDGDVALLELATTQQPQIRARGLQQHAGVSRDARSLEVGALYAFLDVRQVHDPARSHRAR